MTARVPGLTRGGCSGDAACSSVKSRGGKGGQMMKRINRLFIILSITVIGVNVKNYECDAILCCLSGIDS